MLRNEGFIYRRLFRLGKRSGTAGSGPLLACVSKDAAKLLSNLKIVNFLYCTILCTFLRVVSPRFNLAQILVVVVEVRLIWIDHFSLFVYEHSQSSWVLYKNSRQASSILQTLQLKGQENLLYFKLVRVRIIVGIKIIVHGRYLLILRGYLIQQGGHSVAAKAGV